MPYSLFSNEQEKFIKDYLRNDEDGLKHVLGKEKCSGLLLQDLYDRITQEFNIRFSTDLSNQKIRNKINNMKFKERKLQLQRELKANFSSHFMFEGRDDSGMFSESNAARLMNQKKPEEGLFHDNISTRVEEDRILNPTNNTTENMEDEEEDSDENVEDEPNSPINYDSSDSETSIEFDLETVRQRQSKMRRIVAAAETAEIAVSCSDQLGLQTLLGAKDLHLQNVCKAQAQVRLADESLKAARAMKEAAALELKQKREEFRQMYGCDPPGYCMYVCSDQNGVPNMGPSAVPRKNPNPAQNKGPDAVSNTLQDEALDDVSDEVSNDM